MATSDLSAQPGAPCKRTLSIHHAICELPTPCPLHDPPRWTLRREVLLTLRYTLERVGATLTALWIARHWLA